MSIDGRHQLLKELGDNLRNIGIAVLGLVAVLVPLRYTLELDFLEIYIILIGISSLFLLSSSIILLIYLIIKYPKTK